MSWAVLQDASIKDITEKYAGKPEPWALRVADWWRRVSKEKCKTPIGLSRISLVLVHVETLGELYDKKTHLKPAEHNNNGGGGGDVPNTRPFILYYAIPPGQPSGWQGAIHILGLGLTDKLESTKTIGDLLHTFEYALSPEESLRWFGASNEHYWFKFCFDPPSSRSSSDNKDETVSNEHIAYRAQLADVFWTERGNAGFLQGGGDGYEMLRQLHEDQSGIEHMTQTGKAEAESEERADNYFELGSSRGRAHEYISYWMFALSAAMAPRDSFMKKKRAHFERELLRFRLQRYFFRDVHFSRLILKNRWDGQLDNYEEETDNDDVRVVEDPGNRERQLFASRRHKNTWSSFNGAGGTYGGDEEPVSTWISIPEQHAGKEIVADSRYDIDNGRVIITRYDLFQWAWTRMEVGVRTLTAGLSDGYKERRARVRQAVVRQNLFPRQLAPECIQFDPFLMRQEDCDDEEDTRPSRQEDNDDAYWSMFSDEHRDRERAIAESIIEAERQNREHLLRYDEDKERTLRGSTATTAAASSDADANEDYKNGRIPDHGVPDPGMYFSNEERLYWLNRAKRTRFTKANPVHLTLADGPPVMPMETSQDILRADMTIRQLHWIGRAADDRDNAAIEALRLLRLGAGPIDGLSLDRVKKSFPPCMGRIVMDALVHRMHPKHKPRVSLVKFLLEAGFSVQDVDKLIYDMYEADRDYVYREHAGRWDKEAYNTVFKGASLFTLFFLSHDREKKQTPSRICTRRLSSPSTFLRTDARI